MFVFEFEAPFKKNKQFQNISVLPVFDGALTVMAFNQLADRLNLVKVKGVFSGDWAIKSGLQEWSPHIFVFVWPTVVVFADPGHPRKYGFSTVGVFHGT